LSREIFDAGPMSQTNDFEHLTDKYITVWNETSPEQRRALVGDLWTDDAVYANSFSEFRGHEEIATGITRSHDKWVGSGHTFASAGPPDSHHNVVRFVWHMYGSDSVTPVSIGTNFMMFNDDGRIVSDFQYIDQ
jgi:SnoaL-like domain